MPGPNTGDHSWMARDDLRDGVIQNIAQWLPSTDYGSTGPGVFPVIDIRAAPYNAILDRNSVSDGNISSGKNVLTTTTSTPFAVTDIGKAISVRGAGSNPGAELRTTIASFQSASQVTLAANATKTVASRTVTDAVTVAASATLTSATAAFVSTDVGSPITGDNIPPNTIIQAFTNATTVTMSQNAMASNAGTGTLSIFNGVRWGTDLNNSLTTGILVRAVIALTPTGGIIQIPGFAVCTQAIRWGVSGQVNKTTVILDFMGSGGIDFINGNSQGFLETAGTNPATRCPQMIVRNGQIDGCHSGYGTDGLMNRYASNAIDNNLPYAWFTTKGQTGYPATASTNPATFGTSTATSATSLTDGAAAWTLNQWAGARVVIDEDKASNGTNVGAGYAPIIGNTPTVLQIGGWVGTKQTGQYTPSGAVVRYRIHTDVFQGLFNTWEKMTFLRPPGFLASGLRSRYVDCVVEGAGQWGDPASHNDTFGGAGFKSSFQHVVRKNSYGNFIDLAPNIPGLFPEVDLIHCESIGNAQATGIFPCGVGSRIVGYKAEPAFITGGIGYDASGHAANRGKNIVIGCEIPSNNVAGTGLQALYQDRVLANLAVDSPWFQGNGTNPTPMAITFVSGTGQQVDVLRDTFIVVPITFTPSAGAAATCTVALSYDGGTTYTNIGASPMQVPAGIALDNIIMPVQLYVQGGVFVKLTVNAQASIGVGQVIF